MSAEVARKGLNSLSLSLSYFQSILHGKLLPQGQDSTSGAKRDQVLKTSSDFYMKPRARSVPWAFSVM